MNVHSAVYKYEYKYDYCSSLLLCKSLNSTQKLSVLYYSPTIGIVRVWYIMLLICYADGKSSVNSRSFKMVASFASSNISLSFTTCSSFDSSAQEVGDDKGSTFVLSTISFFAQFTSKWTCERRLAFRAMISTLEWCTGIVSPLLDLEDNKTFLAYNDERRLLWWDWPSERTDILLVDADLRAETSMSSSPPFLITFRKDWNQLRSGLFSLYTLTYVEVYMKMLQTPWQGWKSLSSRRIVKVGFLPAIFMNWTVECNIRYCLQ